MKKHSKILLLLLALLVLSSIFVVTSFAEDGEVEGTEIPEGAAIEYTNADGEVSYHAASEFSALVSAGGAIKLLADVDLDCKPIPVKKSISIDLNGYDLRRSVYYGKTYEATDNGDGTYTYTETVLSTTTGGSQRDFFSINTDNKTLKIFSSSSDRGTIYNAVASADTWVCGETVVKRTIKSYYNSNLILATYLDDNYYSKDMVYVIENVDIYSQSLMYQTHGNVDYSVTIDNIKHYAMKYTSGDDYGASNTFMLGTKENLDFIATNSLFYSPLASSNFFRLTNSSSYDAFASVIFRNCDIVKTQTSYAYGITNARASNSIILFDNCRINDLNGTTAKAAYAVNGTITPKASDSQFCPAYTDFSRVDLKTQKKITYVVPNTTAFTANTSSDVQFTNLEYSTKNATITFTQIYTKDITINWMNGEELIKSEVVTPGVTSLTAPSIAPYYDETDDFRNIAYQWADALEGGKAVTEVPGWDASYNFYAVTEIDGVKNYVSGLKGAMLNMTYMAHFAYNLYVPKVEGVTVNKIAGKDPGKTVYIYDREYYVVNAGYPTSTDALNDSNVTVTYTIDGQNFSASLKFDAILYAQLATTDPKATEIEKESVACLVRYIHESYKYVDADHVLEDATEAVFQDFYTNYRTPADYTTTYPPSEVHTVNEAAIAGLVESISFTVIGPKVTFAVTLTEEAYQSGYRILFGNVGYKDKISSDGKTYYTDNRSLVSNLMSPTYSITVTDSNYTSIKVDLDGDGTAETTAKTNYSMATYIVEMEKKGHDVTLAKSLYALGVACKQVRETLY